MRAEQDAEGPPPWVRVIIVNYNAGQMLQPCIDALAAQTFADFEVVVVDNASTDGSADALSLPDRRFRIIFNASNAGFAAANNIGARDCRAPWLAMLNPDTVAEPDWLEEMHRGTIAYPEAHMFGATLVQASDPSIVDGFGDVLTIAGIPWRGGCGRPVTSLPDCDTEVFSPCAAAALYFRESFERERGFDEAFFCYVEDVDLGLRMRMSAERCMQLRRAVVRHHASAITGELSEFTLFYSYRNRLWLLFKDMPLLLLIIAVPLNVVCSLIIIWRFHRAGLPVKAAVRGLLSGLAPVAALKQRKAVQGRRTVSTAAVARGLVWNLLLLRKRPMAAVR